MPAPITAIGQRIPAARAGGALLTEAYPRIRSLARFLTSDYAAAEDLVQDTFVVALTSGSTPSGPDELYAWLRGVMIRLNFRRLRRARSEIRALLRVAGHRPVEWPPLSRASEELVTSLRDLSQRQRACIVLRYFEDLSEVAIAESLGIRVGTVKAHLAQGRLRLRRDLASMGVDGID